MLQIEISISTLISLLSYKTKYNVYILMFCREFNGPFRHLCGKNILISFNKTCFCCCQTEYSLSVKSIILIDSVLRSNTPLAIFCLHDLSINEKGAKAVTTSKRFLCSFQFFFQFCLTLRLLFFSEYNCRDVMIT